LIGWVLQRLDWLKVVLVANRSDNMDSLLLELAKKQVSNSDSCTVKPYFCRLPLSFIEQYTKNDPNLINQRSVAFVVAWHRAARSLFSDEALSLRTVKKLLEEYQKGGSSHVLIENLKSVLLPKMPFLGKYCCHKFTQYLLECYESYVDNAVFPEGETSPLRLLVKTGLADKEGEWISFPEFSSTIPSSHKVHPIVRLAAWVKVIWTQAGVSEDHVMASLGCLTRLQVVDQAKFPFIMGESGATDFSRGEVFSKSGFYSDIMWLADTINHGHAVNWETIKETWKNNYISSSHEFSHLLSVCPDPAACLASVTPKNLCILIEGDEGTSIAEHCVLSCPPDTRNDPNSVYFTAAWNLYRNTPDIFIEKKINTLDTLLWASQFAFSLVRVKEDPVKCTERLQKTLIEETNALFHNAENIDKIALLWSHLFAGLMVVGENGIEPAVAIALSRKVHPIPAEWPEVLKVLAHVEDLSATHHHLERLFTFFSQSPGLLDNHFVHRLLALQKRTLSPLWQYMILTSDVTLKKTIPNITTLLEEGLRLITNASKIMIQGPNAATLKRAICEVER
jgi:hypothetical protein